MAVETTGSTGAYSFGAVEQIFKKLPEDDRKPGAPFRHPHGGGPLSRASSGRQPASRERRYGRVCAEAVPSCDLTSCHASTHSQGRLRRAPGLGVLSNFSMRCGSYPPSSALLAVWG